MVKGILRVATASIAAIMLVACSTGGGDRTVMFDNGAQIRQLDLRPMAAQQDFSALSVKTAEPSLMLKPMSGSADAEPAAAKANTIVSVSAQARAQEQISASQHCPGRVGYSSLDD